MKLRTGMLGMGVLGAVALAAGLVANAQRLEPIATPGTDVNTAVVIVSPDLLAMDPTARLNVSASGQVHAFAARPGDVQAWLGVGAATYLIDIDTWEQLRVRTAEAVHGDVAPSPAPTTDPSPDTGAQDEPESADADAEVAGDDSAQDPEPEPEPEAWVVDSDMWRQTWHGQQRLSIGAHEVEPGLTVMFVSGDGAPLERIEMRLERQINDAWINPVTFAGLILTLIGVLTLLAIILPVERLRTVARRAGQASWLHAPRRALSRVGEARSARAANLSEGVVDISVEVEEVRS